MAHEPGRIAYDVLERRPTLTVGQADDLKLDTGTTRYWLSRCGIEDGEPFEHTVHVERLEDGCWVTVLTYDGDDDA